MEVEKGDQIFFLLHVLTAFFYNEVRDCMMRTPLESKF